MDEPTDRQRQFVRELITGQRCAECGELHASDFDCQAVKREVLRRAFPKTHGDS